MSLSANGSNYSSADDETSKKSTLDIIVTTGSNLVVCIMILVNNTLLLVTLAKTRQLWTRTNAYIASLSVADLLVGILLTIRPFWVIPSTEWLFNQYKFVCMPIICLLYVSSLESLACLVLVSTDRYLYIVQPYWYERNITMKRTCMLLAASWMMSITFGFLPMKLNTFSPSIGCNPMTIISKTYLFYCLSSYFFLAASTISFMYGRVFCVGNQHRRKIEAAATAVAVNNQRKTEKSRWQVIRFLILVCGIFFLCWFPLAITVLFYFTMGAPTIAISITVSLAGLNSSLNFFVFMAMDRTFKKALFKHVCRCWRKSENIRAAGPRSVEHNSQMSENAVLETIDTPSATGRTSLSDACNGRVIDVLEKFPNPCVNGRISRTAQQNMQMHTRDNVVNTEKYHEDLKTPTYVQNGSKGTALSLPGADPTPKSHESRTNDGDNTFSQSGVENSFDIASQNDTVIELNVLKPWAESAAIRAGSFKPCTQTNVTTGQLDGQALQEPGNVYENPSFNNDPELPNSVPVSHDLI